MNESNENYWKGDIDDYTEVMDDNRQYLLLPELARFIIEGDGKKVLDHGCGEGYLSKKLPDDYEIGIFDISQTMIRLAKENLKNKSKLTVFNSNEEINSDHFDFAVSSLVLMTIREKSEYLKILKTLRRSVHSDGKILIALTHPCFRQYHFSTYQTEFSQGKPFGYLENNSPFRVFIKSDKNNFSVFEDFHHSLSYTTNLIHEAGIKIVGMKELADKTISEGFYNEYFPPYLVIIGEK